jgi:DNA-binding response OmpR family regulator
VGAMRFLVIDDDRSTVNGMTLLLRGDGHEVSGFTIGAEAVAALAVERFDAVVTDLEMPGVDGFAVARTARAHQRGACVAVVSACTNGAHAALAEAGACIVVDKPVDYDSLTRAIAACQAHGGAGRCDRCRDGKPRSH